MEPEAIGFSPDYECELVCGDLSELWNHDRDQEYQSGTLCSCLGHWIRLNHFLPAQLLLLLKVWKEAYDVGPASHHWWLLFALLVAAA